MRLVTRSLGMSFHAYLATSVGLGMGSSVREARRGSGRWERSGLGPSEPCDPLETRRYDSGTVATAGIAADPG